MAVRAVWIAEGEHCYSLALASDETMVAYSLPRLAFTDQDRARAMQRGDASQRPEYGPPSLRRVDWLEEPSPSSLILWRLTVARGHRRCDSKSPRQLPLHIPFWCVELGLSRMARIVPPSSPKGEVRCWLLISLGGLRHRSERMEERPETPSVVFETLLSCAQSMKHCSFVDPAPCGVGQDRAPRSAPLTARNATRTPVRSSMRFRACLCGMYSVQA